MVRFDALALNTVVAAGEILGRGDVFCAYINLYLWWEH